MKHSFKARIYKTGINWCVNVPGKITRQLEVEKGYIRIRGTVNGYKFDKSLVPVKDAPYRLFVNGLMMKGGNTALGKVAHFEIEQDKRKPSTVFKMPSMLKLALEKNTLLQKFRMLSPSRRKEINRYLAMLKSEQTIRKHVDRVIAQLMEKKRDVRIP